MNCNRCGNEIPTYVIRGERFDCPSCGHRYYRRTPVQSNQRKSVTPQRKPLSRQKTVLQKLRDIPWKKKYAKLPLWAWTMIAVMLLIGFVATLTKDSDEITNADLRTHRVTVEPSSSVKTSEPINDPFEYTADKVLKNNYTIKHTENNDINLRFKIDGWNEEKTIDCFKLYACNFAKMLSQEFPKCTYRTLYFVGWVDTIDSYGRTGTADAIRLAIDKTEIDKVNWDRFSFKNIEAIGHDYTIGTILR